MAPTYLTDSDSKNCHCAGTRDDRGSVSLGLRLLALPPHEIRSFGNRVSIGFV